jgi:hypothetical protein
VAVAAHGGAAFLDLPVPMPRATGLHVRRRQDDKPKLHRPEREQYVHRCRESLSFAMRADNGLRR